MGGQVFADGGLRATIMTVAVLAGPAVGAGAELRHERVGRRGVQERAAPLGRRRRRLIVPGLGGRQAVGRKGVQKRLLGGARAI